MTDRQSSPGLELEYNAAKQEVLKRIDVRYQIISITITVAGAFYGFGWGSGSIIILIFPVISFCLALGWIQNEMRIKHLNDYIYEGLGKSLPGLGWSAYIREKAPQMNTWFSPLLSPGSVFLLIHTIAVALGLLRSMNSFAEYFMFAFDIVLLAGLWMIMREVIKFSGYNSA